MNISYRVHRVSTHQVRTIAVLPSGEAITATSPGVEIELVPVSNSSGSITLRFVGADATDAQAYFHQDDVVTVPWGKTKGES